MAWVVNNISLIFSLLFFVFILGGAFIGFLQGGRKSLYYVITTTSILVIGILLVPVISNKILDINLYKVPGLKSTLIKLEGDLGVEITNLRALLPPFLQEKFPDQAALFVPGTEIMSLIYGLIGFGISFIMYIVVIIFYLTVVKFIAGIVWIFVRPKKDKFGKKPKKNRSLGALLGAGRAFIFLFVISIPIAGVVSIAEDSLVVMSMLDDDNSGATVFQNNELDDFDFTELPSMYRKSVPGFLYGLKFGHTRIDESFFDMTFPLKVRHDDRKNETIRIRKEIKSVMNIVNVVIERNDNGLDIDESLAFKITSSDLNKIKKNLKNIKLINVLKNVGVEFLYDSELLENIDPAYEEHLTLEKFKEIDLNKDLQSLLDALSVIVDSDAKKDNLDDTIDSLFSLTQEEATEIFNLIADTDTVRMALTIAANLLFQSESIQDLLDEHNIDESKVFKPTPDELVSDFKNIVNIYNLAVDVGFEDSNQMINVLDNLEIIEDQHIIDLINIVFEFTFIYKNDELFAALVYDVAVKDLPEDFKDFLTQERIKNTFTAAELSHLAIIGKTILEAYDLDTGEFDYDKLFTDTNIDKLAFRFSSSDLLTDGFHHFVNAFLADTEFEFEILIPEDDFTLKGTEGEREIKALLKTAKMLLALDIDKGLDAFDFVEDEELEELALYLSQSKIIDFNLKNIIESFSDEENNLILEVPTGVEFFGNSREFEGILKTFKSISIFTGGVDTLKTLTEEEIDYISTNISSSKIISHNVTNLLDYAATDILEGFGFELLIPEEPIKYYDAEGETEGKEELKNTLYALRELALLNFIDSDAINDVSYESIETLSMYLSRSILLSYNIESIADFLAGGDLTINSPGDVVYYDELDENGDRFTEGWEEIENIFKTFKASHSLRNFDSFKTIEKEEIDDLSHYMSHSKLISYNVSEVIDSFTKQGDTDYGFTIVQPTGDDAIDYYGPSGEAELKYMLYSFKNITSENLTDYQSFKNIDDTVIDEMAVNFSSSTLIRYNLTNIINTTSEGTEFEFITLDENTPNEYWDELEVGSTLRSLKVFSAKDLTGGNYYLVTPQEAEEIGLSKTMTIGIKNKLETDTAPGGSLDGTFKLSDDPNVFYTSYYDSNDDLVEGEIAKLLNRLNVVLDGDNIDDLNMDLDMFKTLDYDYLFESASLEITIVDYHIKPFILNDFEIYFVEEYKDGTQYEWYSYLDGNGDLVRGDSLELLDSIKALDNNGFDLLNIDYISFKDAIGEDDYAINTATDAFITSNILNASLHKLLNQLLVEEAELDVTVNDPVDLTYWGYAPSSEASNQGELYFLIDGLLIGDGYENRDFQAIDSTTVNEFKEDANKLVKSDTLRPIMAKILDEQPLLILDAFRYSETDAEYIDPKLMTSLQWSEEIDVLGELIVELNDEFDLGGVPDPVQINRIADLLEDSKLYDKQKFLSFIYP